MKFSPFLQARILLVDQSRDGLLVRRTLLEEQGMEVELARNSAEALDRASVMQFDVVVTNSRELIGRVRSLNPQARVILLAGFHDRLESPEQTAGADATILKNNQEPANLLRAMRRLLSRPARKPAGREAGPRSAPQTRVSVR